MLSPFHLKRLSIFTAPLGDIEPFVRERAAHAAQHAAIGEITDRCFHDPPCRGGGKKHRLLCAEQRLKLWMNLAVKISEIFATMANQRPAKRCPRFFGNFNGAGNEKLVVRMHDTRSALFVEDSTSKAGGSRPPRPACGRGLR